MKIAHYMPPYPACDGSSAFCRGLGRAMNEIAPGSCSIITCRSNLEHESGIPLLHYPGPKKHPFSIPPGLEDDLVSGALEVDGVVLHGTYNPPMVGLARLLRKIGMPYIFVPHDPYPPALRQHHRWRKTAFWYLFEKRMIENAVAVQLLDSSHERFLRELGCNVPTFVQPNGCEPETLELLEGARHSAGSRDQLQIHYLGRMDRNHKGLDLLIEAFSRVASRSGAELCLTGNDWNDRHFLEKLSENLGVANRVHFRGRRPEPSIVLQAEADLCVLTSRFDGFGLTIVEAMLAGRPVLVSSQAGVATHVRNAGGGWVVEPTVDDIARGLEEALNAKARWADYGEKNREYVLENLTWEGVARSTLESYRNYFGQ